MCKHQAKLGRNLQALHYYQQIFVNKLQNLTHRPEVCVCVCLSGNVCETIKRSMRTQRGGGEGTEGRVKDSRARGGNEA